MKHLEDLSLYLRLENGPTSNLNDYFDNEIPIHLSMLRTFAFHITSEIEDEPCLDDDDPNEYTTSMEMLTNVKHCNQVAHVVDECIDRIKIHRFFSIPFKFNLLQDLSQPMPGLIFHSVTDLHLNTIRIYDRKFFVEINRNFPFVENLTIRNDSYLGRVLTKIDEEWLPIMEYSRLRSLDIYFTCSYCADAFLNERKTSLPRLTQLKISYGDLQTVTNNFTRAVIKRNCSQIKLLYIDKFNRFSNEIYDYLPSILKIVILQ